MSSPLARLGFGAAQFPLDGAAPARGRPPEAEVAEIMSLAARSGLSVFDTTHGAPHAEQVIGERMPRPAPYRVMVKTSRADRGGDYIEDAARASLRRLGMRGADAIVVQVAGDLMSPYGGDSWNRLCALRDEGVFKKIGISVFASDDPVGLVKRFKPDIVQAPASLLDQRLLADGSLARIAEMGIEVQLRSIFLQGLLFLPPDRVPGPMKNAASMISRVRRMIAEGRSDPLQAALGFALSRPEASSVLVGVTSAAELQAIIAAANRPPPDLDWNEMALADASALDGKGYAA
ncbi:aldo/keto reductase [Phenylobacterium montanum]|uniref:Aldo/keto reductase n=1 Tax=Phenylobacterium montanum TaxID=2823693 RepID=A0A975FXR3_9CAUL|nr:aldo/keto reductase [Caulobacter sp. S6]QUD87096.1 aldo/keto reductase [Caulobacter sp. S6]